MKEEQRRKLNRLIWLGRLRTLAKAAAVLIPLLVILVVWYDPPVAGDTVTGTLVGRRTVESFYGSSPRFLVELGPDQIVVAQGAKHLAYDPGETVSLRVYEGMVFGSLTYRVLRYEDD